ncbi:MAG: hypothetical protein H7Y16_01475 [Candidatus Parcubacteria bacterium]|nr:hypothetical protein [Burkholderiales bacterium]
MIAAVLCLAGSSSRGADAEAGSAAGLRARYVELRSQLGSNQFRKPLHLDSSESKNGVSGDIYALVEHPFGSAAAALNSPQDWCEIMLLHINTKHCRVTGSGQATTLNVSIGKKHDQPVDEAFRTAFAYRVAAQAADYLQVTLKADQGPLSTRDYRIVMEAAPVDGGRTFIHLSYSYAFGLAGKLAMQVYLNTAGSNKVGFTVAGKQADGQPRHIGGMRGVVERNTMRYYLAIESHLGALSSPPQSRLEKRLRDWFAATERYPRQLHEMEQGEYLEMKRREFQRQALG